MKRDLFESMNCAERPDAHCSVCDTFVVDLTPFLPEEIERMAQAQVCGRAYVENNSLLHRLEIDRWSKVAVGVALLAITGCEPSPTARATPVVPAEIAAQEQAASKVFKSVSSADDLLAKWHQEDLESRKQRTIEAYEVLSQPALEEDQEIKVDHNILLDLELIQAQRTRKIRTGKSSRDGPYFGSPRNPSELGYPIDFE